MLNSFFRKFSQATVEDIIQLGVVDIDREESFVDFIPIGRSIYIDFGQEYIHLTVEDKMNEPTKLGLSYEHTISETLLVDYISHENDIYPAKESIAEIILTDTLLDNSIDYLCVYGGELVQGKCICDAFSIRLNCGQLLFFDPSFHYGINIGGTNQRENWILNHSLESNNELRIR